MKRYATTLLLWASLLVGEVHTFWEDSTKSENWIIGEKVEMPIQWNLKYAGDEVIGILIALAIVFYNRNRINETAAKVFVVYHIADFMFYFYNFKREGYELVYFIILIFWILIYNHGCKHTSKRQGATTYIEQRN